MEKRLFEKELIEEIPILGTIEEMVMDPPNQHDDMPLTGDLDDRIPRTKIRYTIGQFCVIAPDLSIGDNVTIENFVEIQRGVKVGAGSTIRSFCRIGKDCTIGDHATLKCAAITGPSTVIEDACFIGPQVVFLSDLRTGKTGSIAKVGSFIGAGTLVMPNITISPGAFVGASSVVNRDCEPGKAYVGTPIRELKESAEAIIERLFHVHGVMTPNQ